MRAQSLILAALLLLAGLLSGCGSKEPLPEPTPTHNVLQGAAAEATALVQQAQATAIVLEARVKATALVEQARLAGVTPSSATGYLPASASPPVIAPDETPTPQAIAGEEQVDEAIPVKVLSVGFAAEGGMIMVRFLASPDEAETWWQGNAVVTDEGNGAVYNEIPVMPVVGPLNGRPKAPGQTGYVMLVNSPPYLRPGALVTVLLGKHRFEHVPVE